MCLCILRFVGVRKGGRSRCEVQGRRAASLASGVVPPGLAAQQIQIHFALEYIHTACLFS